MYGLLALFSWARMLTFIALLVGYKNGFKRDFTIELKWTEGLTYLNVKQSPSLNNVNTHLCILCNVYDERNVVSCHFASHPLYVSFQIINVSKLLTFDNNISFSDSTKFKYLNKTTGRVLHCVFLVCHRHRLL